MKTVCLLIALLFAGICAAPVNAQQYTWPYIFGPNATNCNMPYCYDSENCFVRGYCQVTILGSQSCAYPHSISLNDGIQATSFGCPYQTYLLAYMTSGLESEYYNYNPYTGVTGWIYPQSLVAIGILYESVMGQLFDLYEGYAWEDCYNGTPGSFNTGNKPC